MSSPPILRLRIIDTQRPSRGVRKEEEGESSNTNDRNDGSDDDSGDEKEKGESNNTNNDNDNDSGTDDDSAVEDTDLPDEVAKTQMTQGDKRRQGKQQIHPAQKLLPFKFSPMIRPLTISDLESCIALENAAFSNPAHRCTREKFEYRLTQCPDLCMGVFCTVVPSDTKEWEIETLHTAHPVETGRDNGAVSVLLAHIVATKSHDDVVTDDAMDYPHDDNMAVRNVDGEELKIGHQKTGWTLCIHSLAVHPKLRGVGLGKMILHAYMKQAYDAVIANSIALICQEDLVDFYYKIGFTHVGPSKAIFSGGGWHDMTYSLIPVDTGFHPILNPISRKLR